MRQHRANTPGVWRLYPMDSTPNLSSGFFSCHIVFTNSLRSFIHRRIERILVCAFSPPFSSLIYSMDLNLSFGFSINRECFHFGSWSSPSLRQIYCTSLPSSRLAVPISGPSLLSFHVRVGDSSRVIVHFIVECATPSQARKVSRAISRQQGALVVSYALRSFRSWCSWVRRACISAVSFLRCSCFSFFTCSSCLWR